MRHADDPIVEHNGREYKHSELSAALDAVLADPKDWRGPIDGVVLWPDLQRPGILLPQLPGSAPGRGPPGLGKARRRRLSHPGTGRGVPKRALRPLSSCLTNRGGPRALPGMLRSRTRIRPWREHMNHTPGPWEFVPGEDNIEGGDDLSAGSVMARPYHLARVWNDAPNPETDGRLLAAAPELLAALEECADVLEDLRPRRELNTIILRARALIAKTKGGCP